MAAEANQIEIRKAVTITDLRRRSFLLPRASAAELLGTVEPDDAPVYHDIYFGNVRYTFGYVFHLGDKGFCFKSGWARFQRDSRLQVGDAVIIWRANDRLQIRLENANGDNNAPNPVVDAVDPPHPGGGADAHPEVGVDPIGPEPPNPADRVDPIGPEPPNPAARVDPIGPEPPNPTDRVDPIGPVPPNQNNDAPFAAALVNDYEPFFGSDIAVAGFFDDVRNYLSDPREELGPEPRVDEEVEDIGGFAGLNDFKVLDDVEDVLRQIP